MKTFSRPPEFPNEAFVQKAIEQYFTANGYEIDGAGQIDLKAWKNKEDWVIEAKGITKAIRVDFNTCMGQLIGHIDNENTKYAIALPRTEEYIYQCKNLPDFIRRRLGLHIIFVDGSGKVNITYPGESIEG